MGAPKAIVGKAYLPSTEDGAPGRFMKVKVTERGPGRTRIEPFHDSDREAFLEHIGRGGTVSLQTKADADDQKGFREGMRDGFGSAGGLGGMIGQRIMERIDEEEPKPIDKG